MDARNSYMVSNETVELLSFEPGRCRNFLYERFGDSESCFSNLLSDHKNTLGILGLGLCDQEVIDNMSDRKLLLNVESYFCSIMLDPNNTDNSQALWVQLSQEQQDAYARQFRSECISQDSVRDSILHINARIWRMRQLIDDLARGILNAWEAQSWVIPQEDMKNFSPVPKTPTVLKMVSKFSEKIINTPRFPLS